MESDLPTGEKEGRPGSGRWPALIGLLVFVAALAALMIKLESDAVSDPVKKAERGEVVVSNEYSLTKSENLTVALEAIEADLPPGGYLEHLRVSPAGIDAIVVEESGLRRNVTVNVAFELESSESGAADSTGPRPIEIPAEAVERIIAAGEDYGLEAANFQYAAVFLGNPTATTWSAFWEPPLKDNSLLANLDGTSVYLSGETPPPEAVEEIIEDAVGPIELPPLPPGVEVPPELEQLFPNNGGGKGGNK
jgi:hypothetical protein